MNGGGGGGVAGGVRGVYGGGNSSGGGHDSGREHGGRYRGRGRRHQRGIADASPVHGGCGMVLTGGADGRMPDVCHRPSTEIVGNAAASYGRVFRASTAAMVV